MKKCTDRILWIDDNDENGRFARARGWRFILYDGTDAFWPKLRDRITDPRLHLIVIDHKLDRAATPYSPKQGLSIAQYIKESAFECPIVGYSAAPEMVSMMTSWYEMDRAYDDMFLLRELLRDPQCLALLASDFTEFRNEAGKIGCTDDIMTLVKAPKDDCEILMKTLPDYMLVNTGANTKKQVLLLARWIRKVLMNLPGFLYDSLGAATHVGLTDKAFSRPSVQRIFKKALYRGAFVRSHGKPLWWASILREIAFNRYNRFSKSRTWIVYSWLAGQYLMKGLRNEDLSKCFNCRKGHPEMVGYVELTRDIRAPLHLACSKPHPYKKPFPHFDEPRISEG